MAKASPRKKAAAKPAKKSAAKKPAAKKVKAAPKKTAAKKPAKKPKKKAAKKTAAPKRPAPKKIVQTKPQGKKTPQQKPTPLTATGSNVLWKLLANRKAQAEVHHNDAFSKMVDKATEKERFANHQARFSRFAGPRRRAS